MSTMRFPILALAAATIAACSYNPDYGDGTVQCGPGGLCPGNLRCDTADNICRSNPGGGDDDIDAADMDGDVDTDGGVDIDATADTTPPNTILVSTPSAISGVNVTFIVDSTEPNSTFACSVDSTTLMPCTATQMFTNLVAGTHTFRAAATDMAGNEDTTPVEYTWMVDPTVLDTTITMGPGAISGPNVSFSFTATRPGTFECQLSPMESSFTPCSSPKMYTGLTQIPSPGYTFQVRAKDTAGNLDASPASQMFLVDTTPPTVNITAPTNNATVGTSFTLTFTSDVGTTHTCQLDSQTVINPCNSGRTFMNLTSAANPHTIKVTGTDQVGNSATVMNTFTVDDTGPTLTISGAPANGTTVSSTTASLTFSIVPASEPTPFSFECKFNGAATFTACSNFTTSGLTQGTQTLQVRAKDRFGNIGGVVTHTWDVQPMTTTINAIRTSGIAIGTLVRLSTNIRVTAKTNNRYWVQEQDGATNPPPTNRGITIMPTAAIDSTIVPGRSQTIVGIVSNMNGNLVITSASFFNGSLLAPYNAKDTNRDSLVLLSEANEGMLVNSSGRASTTAAQSCQDFDFCIVSCERSTPVINSIDGVTSGQVMINRDHVFEGIVEGIGTGFVYYVTSAQDQSDACL
jgi:hypothetical protein